MKTFLFLTGICCLCFISFWTVVGFISLVIVPLANSAYYEMPNEPIFFGIDNTFLFFLLAIPAWTLLYFLNKFYKNFDWNDDLIYLTLKTMTRQTSSSVKKAKDQLRKNLDDSEGSKQ